MTLNELIHSLKNNTFRHENLTTLDLFVATHEGLSLFHHMGEHPMYFGLMTASLGQLAGLIPQAQNRTIAKDIFFAHVEFFCQTLINQRLTEGSKYQEILDMYWSPEQYFRFIGHVPSGLKSKTIELIQERIKFFTHMLLAKKHVDECTVEQLLRSSFVYSSAHFPILSPDVHFKSTLKCVWDELSNDFNRFLGRPEQELFPDFEFFHNTISSLSRYNLNTELNKLSQSEIQNLSTLYLFFYRFANDAQQEDLAKRFNDLLYYARGDALEYITKAVIPPFGPCILSRLPNETAKELFTYRIGISDPVTTISMSANGLIGKSRRQGDKLILDYYLDKTASLDHIHQLQYLLYGNFHKITDLHIVYPAGEFPEYNYLREQLASSPKVTFKPISSEQNGVELNRIALMKNFSPYLVAAKFELPTPTHTQALNLLSGGFTGASTSATPVAVQEKGKAKIVTQI